WFPEQSDGQHG
ncbi:hypothetical protein BN1723_020776, partial [Verticillium longisporum]